MTEKNLPSRGGPGQVCGVTAGKIGTTRGWTLAREFLIWKNGTLAIRIFAWNQGYENGRMMERRLPAGYTRELVMQASMGCEAELRAIVKEIEELEDCWKAKAPR